MSWIEERVGKKKTSYRYCTEGQRPVTLKKARNRMEAEAIKTMMDHRALFAEHGIPILDMGWMEWVEEYFRLYEPVHSAQSMIKLRHVVNQFNRIVQPQMLIGIQPRNCEEWQIHRSREVSARSTNMEMSYLSPMFEKALSRKYIQANPFASIKRLRVVVSDARVLTQPQAVAFLETLARDLPHHALLGQFAYETGMRLDEISHQRMENVDFINGLIKVEPHSDKCVCQRCAEAPKPGWIGKAGVPRVIPLSPKLMAMLLERFQGMQQGCLFPCNDTIQHAFKRTLTRIGIMDRACVHVFRHTLGTEMERAGVRRGVLKAILGHGRADVTDAYTGHVAPEELKSEFQKVLDWRMGAQNAAVMHMK